MMILGVDTSAKTTSVCLLKDGALLGEYFLHVSKVHSKTIMPMCEHLLLQVGITPDEIDLYALSTGPGSFTGLRIGMALVKGMAFVTQKPCMPISTLEAIAMGAPFFEGMLCAVMDARRGQFYHACFEQKSGQPILVTADCALSRADLLDQMKAHQKPILLLGDGAALCYEAWHGKLPDLHLAPQAVRYQRASYVAVAAFQKMQGGIDPTNAAELTPTYLRLPQAERDLLEKSLRAEC